MRYNHPSISPSFWETPIWEKKLSFPTIIPSFLSRSEEEAQAHEKSKSHFSLFKFQLQKKQMMQFLRSSDPNQKESENHLLLETPYSNFSSLWMNAWIKIQMRYKKTTLCLSPSPPPSRFLSSPAKLTGRRKYFIFICIPWGTQTNKQVKDGFAPVFLGGSWLG